MQPAVTTVIEQTILSFCRNFLTSPYLCYTEHGMHALFYTQLYNALPPEARYLYWQDQQVCVLQKEYPTADPLGKPRRQHWDIAVLKNPAECLAGKQHSYDYLCLAAVIEFGLNEAWNHLEDDIQRLSHPGANVDRGYFVHLYRLATPKAALSGRDWSNASAQICPVESVAARLAGTQVTGYYGMFDAGGRYPDGLWGIDGGRGRVERCA